MITGDGEILVMDMGHCGTITIIGMVGITGTGIVHITTIIGDGVITAMAGTTTIAHTQEDITVHIILDTIITTILILEEGHTLTTEVEEGTITEILSVIPIQEVVLLEVDLI